MKKQFRMIKTVALLLLVAMMMMLLASCGTGKASADSASGTHGNVSWSYDKDSKTLTVNGTGALASFENAEAVVWSGVRSSAEKLVVGDGITAIGDYAFYLMGALKTVSLPATLVSIGKYSFAYSHALEAIDLPDNLTTLGVGAFEGCGSLRSIDVPATVKAIPERAFAYCYSMTGAMAPAEGLTVGSEAFKNCRALSQLILHTSVSTETVAVDALKGTSMNLANATRVEDATGISTVTVQYVYADGSEALPTVVNTYAYGEEYSIPTPTLEGYTPSTLTVKGTADGTPKMESVVFTKNEETTEAPADTEAETEAGEADEPITATTVIAIVVMVLVLVAIGVGAFLLIRSDKKNAGKNTTTVRKKDGEKGKKSGK